MSIRCLLVAAFAVGFWGVGLAYGQDDPATTDTAEATARADADITDSSSNVAEGETRSTTDIKSFAARFLINAHLADVPADAMIKEESEGAGAGARPEDTTTAGRGQGPATSTESLVTAADVAECCARACGTCMPQRQCGYEKCQQCEHPAPECPCDEWDFKCRRDPPDPCEWRISGELSSALGSSTDADNDRFGFDLKEEMEDCDGNRFEFYQRFDVDHSYVDSNTLTIGARQAFKKWRQNGDLRLQEEFKRYDDLNFDSNDRQEGLFDLKWDPSWDCDRWHAEVAYRYNIKEYETFSPLSYRMHRGRLKIEEKVSDSFDWGVHAEATSYNYSFGSDRDNLRSEVGIEAGWHQEDVDTNLSIEHEDKDFDIRKELGYTENRADLSINWKIDCDSRLNSRFRATDNDRPYEPDRSYQELLADLTYMRQLSCEWALKVRGMARDKEFGDPTDNLNESLGEAELTYQPSSDWTWHANAQRDIYDYADPLRAFTRDRWRLGADYYRCAWTFGWEYERQLNSYDNDPNGDWQRDTISLNAGYRHGRQSFDVRGQFAVLDQSDPASVNDYDETQLSASWTYKIDCKTDFILDYEDRERKYDLQPAVRDRTLEARLRFEL